MSRTRINYKSDLPPVAVQFKIGGTTTPVPLHDFIVRFFVDGSPGVSFCCAYKDGEYINCEKTDNTTLTCYVDNHKFGCGRLCCEYIDLSPNENYGDKVRKTVTPSKLDFILVEGAGDDATDISASVAIDITTLITDAQALLAELEEAIGGKVSLYDASWIAEELTYTEEKFNALWQAIEDRCVIYQNSQIIVAEKETSSSYQPYDKLIRVTYFDSKNKILHIDRLKLYNGAVRFLRGDYITIVESYSKTETDTLLNTKANASAVTSLAGRVSSVETWQESAGSAASIPHYHSATWLESEEGQYDAEHPERRALVRYTSMISGINDNRLIKLGNVTASGVEVNNGVISLVFVVADDAGNTNEILYYVRQPSGADYCEVEKNEIPLPYYDATWVNRIGGGREQMDEIINIIQQSPRALMMIGSTPIVWSQMLNNNVVRFATMLNGGMRVYTVEYFESTGETITTHIDKTFE